MLNRRILSFLALAFGSTWALAGTGYLLGIKDVGSPGYVVLAAMCMLCPAVAALVQQRILDRAPWSGLGLSIRGTRWRIVALTSLLAMLIVPLFLLVVHLLGSVIGVEGFGKVSVTSERFIIAVTDLARSAGQDGALSSQGDLLARIPAGLVLVGVALGGLLAAFSINLPFMLGEELGWRGYLWQRTAHWAGFRRVFFTGVVWGLWHAPLIAMGHNYPGYPIAGIGMMVLFCLLLAFLFDWTRTRSGSIWSSCILHGVINGTAGATVLFAWGGHPLIASIAGLGGMLTIAVLVLLVLVFDRSYRDRLLRPKDGDAAVANMP